MDWLCLQTSPKREYKLADLLAGVGVAAYAPRYRKRVPTSQFSRQDPQPLFPSYLFAEASYLDAKILIQRFPLKFKSRVVGEIDYELIEEIQSRQVGEFVVMDEEPKVPNCRFLKGDAVRTVGGAISGIFDSTISGGERAIILTGFFNQRKSVEVKVCNLEFAIA